MTTDAQKLKRIRPLDIYETYEAVRYARGLFSNVAMSAVYTNPSSKQDLRPLIFHALSKVIAQHPALSTIFMDAKEGSRPYYARLPQIDLRECVIFETRESKVDKMLDGHNPELDSLVEKYHNTRFDERWGELPLWRLVILQDSEDGNSSFVACFVWQHAIGDGNAGPTFHRALLAELCAASAVGSIENPDPIVQPSETPLPQSLESLHRLPLSFRYLLKMAWEDQFPSNGPKLWLGGPVSKPTRSRFMSYSLTAELTSKFVAACRSHSVTLTAACHALVSLSIFANLPPGKTQLKSSMAFNLRRFLPSHVVEGDIMGNYVAAPVFGANRPSSTSKISWQEAQRVKKFLDGEIKRNGKDASTACLRYVSNIHKYFESKFSQARDGSFCLTNLGVFRRRANDTGTWRTERLVFSEASDCAREAICITMITGEDGCLTLGLVWGEGVVEEQLMLKIYETLKTTIGKTANAET